MVKCVVLAGNYKQYTHWLKRYGISESDAMYCSNPLSIRGLEGIDVVTIGTWYDRNDLQDLSQIFRRQQMRVLKDMD